ncbi:MAG: EF-hand domain-containing protein [Methylotenera sp.]|nr:EF-hand domain-containing protein [Methylotenera sp.]
MKITQIVAMVALALGFSQMALADHHGADGKRCAHKPGLQAMDADNDGTISRDEFTEAHQKMADEMFTKLDTNNDGNIDQAEQKERKGMMGKHCKMQGHKMHKMEDSTK